jgi:hypothetical protein
MKSFELQNTIVSFHLEKRVLKIELEVHCFENSFKIRVKDCRVTCKYPHSFKDGMLVVECSPGLILVELCFTNVSVNGTESQSVLDKFPLKISSAFDFFITIPKSQGNIAVCTGELIKRMASKDGGNIIFHYRILTPISLSSVKMVIGAFEIIRLVHHKPMVNSEEEASIPLNSKIDVFFPRKYKRFINASCFYLPQVSGTNIGSRVC